jgi:DNA (cytosine-5)-methyltransferase 1
MTLKLLDTFAGIGGFSLAAHLLGGFETIGFVEREPFCKSILSQNFPGIPIYDDITTFQPEPGTADVICGGFPCQDISLAGKQAGIKKGTRSGLFYELMRVVCMVQPRYVVLENVSAILANGLDTVLGELAETGFDAEWACIPASAVGACHQRDRWWLVAYPSRQQCHERQPADTARTTRTSTKLGNGHGKTAANANNQRQQEQHAATLSSQKRWAGWSDAPQRLNPDWRSYLSEPVLCQGDDGLPGRVDRLKALGNAVVPQVAMIPLQRVLELSSDNGHRNAVR